MTYSDIKTIASRKDISINEIAQFTNLTPDGLKRGIEKKTLGMHYVSRLCDIVGITPNMLFGYKSKGDMIFENGGMLNNNTQNIDSQAVQVLKEQLAEKDRQLAEKDRQIAKLIDLLK